MCRRRIRVPDQWYGDYLSQLGAARIGERRLKAFVAKHGWAGCAASSTPGSTMPSAAPTTPSRRLPEGTLVNSGMHDPVQPFLPESLEITVKVEIDPAAGRIVVDLRDNPDCIDAGLNLTEACAPPTASRACSRTWSPTSRPMPAASAASRSSCARAASSASRASRTPVRWATTNMADVVVNLVQSAFTQLGDGHGLAQGNLCFSAGMGVVSGKDWRRGGAEYINQVYLMGAAGRRCPSTTA